MKRNSGATGPKVSSRKIIASFGTLARTVGSKKVPPSVWRWPPVTTVAPRFSASAMCSSTFFTASALISGPWLTPGSMPLPTFIASTAVFSLAANAS